MFPTATLGARPVARVVRWATAALSFAALSVLAAPCAHAFRCDEVSDIVGYEKCTKYGADWDVNQLPHLQITFGADRYSAAFPSLLLPDGSIATAGPIAFDGARLQVAWDLTGPLVVGVWSTLGFGTNLSPSLHPLLLNDGHTATASAISMTGGGVALVGTTLGPLYAALGARLGGTTTQVSYDDGSDAGENVTGWVVEPEVDLSTWLGPIVTLGVTVGDDVTRRGTTGFQGGLELTFHLLPFEES
jgi:hypothetical protein